MLYLGFVLAALALIALVPALIRSCHTAILTLLSFVPRKTSFSHRPSAKFAIMIRACNIEGKIEGIVRRLITGLDYPHELYDVVVVADSCVDSTAFLAGFAGAVPMEVNNQMRLARVNAMESALNRLLDKGYDGFLMLEPDTMPDDMALRALDHALSKGAQAVQLALDVPDPGLSWGECLGSVMFHAGTHVLSRGRGAAGLSCGLFGDGVCLSAGLLRELPFGKNSNTLDECMAYHLDTVLESRGSRYLSRTAMALHDAASISQWETFMRHKREISRYYSRTLLKSSLKGNLRAFDCLLDLAMPCLKNTLATLSVSLFAGIMLFLSGDRLRECEQLLVPGLAVSALSVAGFAMLSLYLPAALMQKRMSARCWLACAALPFYPVWKIISALAGRGES